MRVQCEETFLLTTRGTFSDFINLKMIYRLSLSKMLIGVGASLVCKRWRGILADRRFVQRFRKHHRKPPLLGYFVKKYKGASFTSMSDFTLITSSIPRLRHLNLVYCRHGVALFLDALCEILVWNPITNVQCHVAFPRGLNHDPVCRVETAAVLCSASDNLLVQGEFMLVLVGYYPNQAKAFTCLYQSKSGLWGEIMSTPARCSVYRNRTSVHVGNTLCWLLYTTEIFQFDFERQTFAVIEKPSGAYAGVNCWHFQPLQTEDGGLGLAVCSKTINIQLWARKSNCDDIVSWVLQKTIQLDDQISHPVFLTKARCVVMMGYDEDTNVIFLCFESCHYFMLQLDSMQFRHIGTETDWCYKMCYPYRNFYTKEAPQEDEGLGSKK
ncbi:hypothetical protein VPH35_114361 [Triticum aestivum]